MKIRELESGISIVEGLPLKVSDKNKYIDINADKILFRILYDEQLKKLCDRQGLRIKVRKISYHSYSFNFSIKEVETKILQGNEHYRLTLTHERWSSFYCLKKFEQTKG